MDQERNPLREAKQLLRQPVRGPRTQPGDYPKRQEIDQQHIKNYSRYEGGLPEDNLETKEGRHLTHVEIHRQRVACEPFDHHCRQRTQEPA